MTFWLITFVFYDFFFSFFVFLFLLERARRHTFHMYTTGSAYTTRNKTGWEKLKSQKLRKGKGKPRTTKNMRRMRSENLVNHSGFHLISLFGRCCCVTKYFLHHISVAWFWLWDGRGVNALPRTQPRRKFCGGKLGEFLSLFRAISGEEWWWDGSDEYLSILKSV